MESEIQPNHRNGKLGLWLGVLLFLVLCGVVVYFLLTKVVPKPKDSKESTTSQSPTVTEKWTRGTKVIMTDVTSSDSHIMSSGKLRTYFMQGGDIKYAESSDEGMTYSPAVITGIKEDSGMFFSNPSVLKIRDDKWIMVYEQSPRRQPGSTGNQPPSATTQRNLYLATSTDGNAFTKVGLVYDSKLNDNYFASVPDLVTLPDGRIRMYFVSRGDSIGSAISTDEGATWTRESGYRLTDMAVDPDVVYRNGKWVMYYTILDPSRNALYVATSTDGLTWGTGAKIIDKLSSNGAIVDADVVDLSSGSSMMLFGEFSAGDSTGGDLPPSLYRAVKD